MTDNGALAVCAVGAVDCLGLQPVVGPFVVRALNWDGIVLTFAA